MIKVGQLTAMISSTAVDLPEHRTRVKDACLAEGVFPSGMEQLPARDASGIQISYEMVDQADIYIGIYAWRYGWVPDSSSISITEMEFNRALERKLRGELKEILIFLMHADHQIVPRHMEADATAQEKLRNFKERAGSGRVRKEFKSPDDLHSLVVQSLADCKRRLEESGRAGSVPNVHAPSGSASFVERIESTAGPIKKEVLTINLIFVAVYMTIVAIFGLSKMISGELAFCGECGGLVVGSGSFFYYSRLTGKGYESVRQEELKLEARKLRDEAFRNTLPPRSRRVR